MISVFAFTVSPVWVVDDDDPMPSLNALSNMLKPNADRVEGWVAPKVHWEAAPGVGVGEIAAFGGSLALSPVGGDAVGHLFEGMDALALGSQAEGWTAFHERGYLDLGIDIPALVKANSTIEPLGIDPGLAVPGLIGRMPGLNWVTVEDDEASTGTFRAWASRAGHEVIRFKRIWNRDVPVDYDSRWAMTSLSDPSILD